MLSLERRDLLAGSIGLSLLALPSAAAANADEASLPFEHSLRPTVHSGTERWTLPERMGQHHVPGVAVAILRGGRVVSLKAYGTRIAGQRAPTNPDTLFSVGSVSKVATAALCLKLTSLGLLNLDENVDRRLRRWRIPNGPIGDDSAITLRMLLSHTSGFNVHGFADYEPDAPLPTLHQTLNGNAPAMNKALARIDRAGLRSRYSGGGYMVIQAIIEDAIGEPFDVVARHHLFGPLGMSRSMFDAAPNAATVNIAHAHDGSGRPVALPRGWQSFAELAPSGLWTSASDLARLVTALIASYQKTNGFLPQELAIDMMTSVSPGTFGLGPRLAGEGAARMFHHAGSNDSYKAYIEGNLASGDGLVIVTNGANGDVLGDEVRNAVSDALAWPGDWSVRKSAITANTLFDSFAGPYRRRAEQSPAMMGILDTIFDIDRLEVIRSDGGLQMQIKDRRRTLAPIASNRFVVPDSYIPAGTLQLQFDRRADRSVQTMMMIGGEGILIFDRATP
jgi:CubicO group peptidase (beta-lactamase class C family)